MSSRLRESVLGAVGDAAQRSPLPRHTMVMPKRESLENIEVGSLYEIDHSKLPPRSPAMLHSIRAVMVTAKTELNVTVRYPSSQSLRAYFGKVDHLPALDEKFVMGPKPAVEVLGREIPSQEFADHNHSKSFWLIDCAETEGLGLPASDSGADTAPDTMAKNGACLSTLQNYGITGWGTKRLIAYVPATEQLDDPEEGLSNLSHVDCKQSLKEEVSRERKEEEFIQYSRKRKRGRPVGSLSNKSKQCLKRNSSKLKPKVEGIEEGESVEWRFKRKSPRLKPKVEVKREGEEVERCFKRNSPKLKPKIEGEKMIERVERWPAMRYEVAAKQLVEVLKANKAVHANPMSRSKLRTETRKRIGDTGLLDHLLKHLAGKVVPSGGNDRLRRRCDDEGKMVYWLESADLVSIRKEAGVKDPYWTPPPGWKPGDRIIPHNCICCQQVTVLKDELSSLRRQATELKIKDESKKATTVFLPESAASSGRFNSKVSYELLVKEKSVLEEQLLKVSKALMELEKDMRMLSCKESKQISVVLSNSESLPAEERNEMNRTSTEDLVEETTEELSESDGEEVERESQASQRPMVIKLKPCRQPENVSYINSRVDRSVEDIMALTPASASPHSTTTS